MSLINRDVSTPNGAGVVQGYTASGVIVRHTIAEMTGKEAGKCWTPNAIMSGIWEYRLEDVSVKLHK